MYELGVQTAGLSQSVGLAQAVSTQTLEALLAQAQSPSKWRQTWPEPQLSPLQPHSSTPPGPATGMLH